MTDDFDVTAPDVLAAFDGDPDRSIMGRLLDTHALLWWLMDDPRLDPLVAERLDDPASDVTVSVATFWEIVIKTALGALDAPDDLAERDRAAGAARAPAVPAGRPWVVAIDGRGGGGKTTLVERLAGAAPGSVVVHTDDVAWHHSFFGWTGLLADGVLRPARDGQAVSYHPPAWDERGRQGSIAVPAGTRLLLVEGVGSGRRELAGLVDAVVWVQSVARVAERRGIDRDVAQGVNGDREQATRFWHERQAEELPFQQDHRTWERAEAVVAGVGLAQAAEGRVLVAGAPPCGWRNRVAGRCVRPVPEPLGRTDA